MTHRLFRYVLSILILIFGWHACDEDDPSVNASRFRLKLTDATSVLMKELHVDISEISVFLVDMTTQEGEWLTLDFSGRVYDVLTLRNGKMVQLVDQYVPAGTDLQQIRIKFGSENRMVIITDDVESIPLNIYPDLEDGLVINAVRMEMRQNTISSMILDLNAALSVRQAMNGDYYLFPSVRAFPETFGGRIKGYVAPLAASPNVMVVQNLDTLFGIPEREKLGDDMLMFQFVGLKEGEWEVHLLANPETGYMDSVITVTVKQGEVLNIPSKPIRLKRHLEEEE